MRGSSNVFLCNPFIPKNFSCLPRGRQWKCDSLDSATLLGVYREYLMQIRKERKDPRWTIFLFCGKHHLKYECNQWFLRLPGSTDKSERHKRTGKQTIGTNTAFCRKNRPNFLSRSEKRFCRVVLPIYLRIGYDLAYENIFILQNRYSFSLS